MTRPTILIAALCITAFAAAAEEPVVTEVRTSKSGMGWRFDVTLSHPDSGWDHFADGWEILDAEGNRLGYRELMHPHVNEQPFTRSLSGVMLPDGLRMVYVRARCSLSDWSGAQIAVPLSR